MSKINITVSYKNACILKHALRDKVKVNEEVKQIIEKEISKGERIADKENYDNFLKESEEEKRALDAVTEEINWYKEKFRI
jgi:hypothetical protein